ncbi:hypothetical protein LLG95_07395 [bacterium]|nr:hypothetical protein [bacterium]
MNFDPQRQPQIPKRLFVAMAISALTLPLPLALSKGNFFHDFTIYDRNWFAFFLAYIIGTSGSVLIIGSAQIDINKWPDRYRGRSLVYVAYFTAAFCFFSMHFLKLFFRGTFNDLRSLL